MIIYSFIIESNVGDRLLHFGGSAGEWGRVY